MAQSASLYGTEPSSADSLQLLHGGDCSIRRRRSRDPGLNERRSCGARMTPSSLYFDLPSRRTRAITAPCSIASPWMSNRSASAAASCPSHRAETGFEQRSVDERSRRRTGGSSAHSRYRWQLTRGGCRPTASPCCDRSRGLACRARVPRAGHLLSRRWSKDHRAGTGRHTRAAKPRREGERDRRRSAAGRPNRGVRGGRTSGPG